MLSKPKFIKDEVTKVAKREGISVNQFITNAVAEKLSALDTESFFDERLKVVDLAPLKTKVNFRTGAGIAQVARPCDES